MTDFPASVGFNLSTLVDTTYVGTPVILDPWGSYNASGTGIAGGQNFYARSFSFDVSIVSGGGQLNVDLSALAWEISATKNGDSWTLRQGYYASETLRITSGQIEVEDNNLYDGSTPSDI
jgi:hypothetical protein